MEKLSKAQKRYFKTLVALAWERELNVTLEVLLQRFQEWKAGTLDAFELEQEIHRFHEGPAREAWKRYSVAPGQTDIAVATAVTRGILEIEEVESPFRSRIEPYLRFATSEEYCRSNVRSSHSFES
ncbi:MAG: hypothetical protein U5J83_10225 [Bryobacterales bacterium]|nr:hypothetical protein [Bryobacterales bacterium]